MYKKLFFLTIIFIILITIVYCNEDIKYIYSMNGRLYISSTENKKIKEITSGPIDLLPSWSISGDKIVFSRINENISNMNFFTWKLAVCVINKDGSGLKVLTDCKHCDMLPTWTRDGKNNIIFTRFDNETKKAKIYITDINKIQGDEKIISDPDHDQVAFTCMKDGRIIIDSDKKEYYALTPNPCGIGKYEKIILDFNVIGLLENISLSPDENKICFDMGKGFYPKSEGEGKTVYYADFDIKSLTISNVVGFTKPYHNGSNPRWTKENKSIIYSSTESGGRQLYIYDLESKKIKKISSNSSAHYTTPVVENCPY